MRGPLRELSFDPHMGKEAKVSDQPYASVMELAAWATMQMRSREPDFIIGDPANPYIRRWWIVPRNMFSNLYLHETLRSDDDRAMHDHPFANTSVLIEGSYIEHTPEGVFTRHPGEIVSRPAHAMHRLEIPEGGRAVSLFFTGPKVREWGFDCPQGWRHWRDFTDTTSGNSITGRGCGED